MKAKDWVYVAAAVAAFVLGALLFRGCQKKPVEVVRYLPVNLDSLKATISPDTVEIPGKQITRIVRVPVLLSDTAKVDSLLTAYYAQKAYYEELIKRLQGDDRDFGWTWDEGVELETKESVYFDSVTTSNYFHQWYIAAEGPIKAYSYKVVPICPLCPTSEPPKKDHHLLLGVGGQFASGLIRPIYLAGYGYKILRVQVGYIAPTQTEKGAIQLQIGVDVPIK